MKSEMIGLRPHLLHSYLYIRLILKRPQKPTKTEQLDASHTWPARCSEMNWRSAPSALLLTSEIVFRPPFLTLLTPF